MSNSSFFDFHCPTGGKWYACAAGSRFVGCCTSDPCTNGCVQGNIRAGGYNISHHGEWPDASCGSASDFFTCNAGDTFWGCCKSNPCAATPPATCAQGDLVPAFMERPEQFNAYAPASVSQTPAPSGASQTPAPSSGSNTGAIVGGVVGGVVGLVIIGVLIFFLLRKQKRKQQAQGGDMGAGAMVPMMNEKPEERLSAQYGGQSPPPTYSSPNPDQGFYQNMTPTKGHHSYHQYANIADGPQELPAEVSSAGNRYSELPAEGSNSTATNRFSELPAEIPRASELESPRPSPRLLQTEFATDLAKQRNQNQGLGVTIEEGPTKK